MKAFLESFNDNFGAVGSPDDTGLDVDVNLVPDPGPVTALSDPIPWSASDDGSVLVSGPCPLSIIYSCVYQGIDESVVSMFGSGQPEHDTTLALDIVQPELPAMPLAAKKFRRLNPALLTKVSKPYRKGCGFR